VAWSEGATRKGSSGSPLIDTATRKVVGVLSGGGDLKNIGCTADGVAAGTDSYHALDTVSPCSVPRSRSLKAPLKAPLKQSL
jgi:hypothetical protein